MIIDLLTEVETPLINYHSFIIYHKKDFIKNK